MSVDIEKICRTCLGLSGPLLSIYDGSSGSNSAGTGCIADMLRDFTKTLPRPDDNLPEKVCLSCISEINRCYSFKLKCENSSRTLRQLLPNAAVEEVFEAKSTRKVAQVHKEVQTMLSPKREKSQLMHKLVQTEVHTTEVATSPVVVQVAKKLRSQTRIKVEERPEGTSIKKKSTKSRRTEKLEIDEENEGEIILELLEEPDDEVCEQHQELPKLNAVEQASYYELTESQLSYNAEDEVVDSVTSEVAERFTYDEVEVQEVEKQRREDRDTEEYAQLVDSVAADGEEQVANYGFTIYDDGEGVTQVVPTLRTTRSSSEKKPNSKCPNCDLSFMSCKTLRRHLVKKHNWSLEQVEQFDYNDQKISPNKAKKEDRAMSELTSEIQQSLLQQLQEEVVLETKTKQEVADTNTQACAEEEEYADVEPDSALLTPVADPNVVKLSHFCGRCNAGFALLKSLSFHQKLGACTAPSFKCDECDRVFISERTLDEHKETHFFSHNCSECNKMFTTVDLLTLHMVNVHKRSLRNQCRICKKVFTMLSTLKDHMRTHSGEKPFECTICGKCFTQNANLKQHIMRHAKEKKYKCDQCPSGFVTNAELRCHKRKHTGDTPFTCDYCDAGFTTSSSLLKHKRKHTGERPYACDICPMRFSSLNVLKNHRRTHTGEKPYKCGYCQKSFTQKGDCHIHQRTHTGERLYSCYCGRKFTHLSTLRSHMKSHTNDAAFPKAGKKRQTQSADDEKEQAVQITIVDVNDEDGEDTQQHEMDEETVEQHVADLSTGDDELMHMNIEMC